MATSTVDRVSRTSVPGVYADRRLHRALPLASVAAMQGRIAMYHALGEGDPIKLKTVAIGDLYASGDREWSGVAEGDRRRRVPMPEL